MQQNCLVLPAVSVIKAKKKKRRFDNRLLPRHQGADFLIERTKRCRPPPPVKPLDTAGRPREFCYNLKKALITYNTGTSGTKTFIVYIRGLHVSTYTQVIFRPSCTCESIKSYAHRDVFHQIKKGSMDFMGIFEIDKSEQTWQNCYFICVCIY